MNLDVVSLLQRLAANHLQTTVPNLSDPATAKSAGTLGLVLQKAALDIDASPGRFRRRAEDIEKLISSYAKHSGNEDILRTICDASADTDTLSGLFARDNLLKAAIITVADAIEENDAAWAISLRRDIRAAYLAWTE